MSDVWSARAKSFDARARQYDDVRPSYPDAAVDAILAFAGLGAGARALEVGSGTGKATRLFLARGLEVLALEPGARLIEVAEQSCASPAVRFVNTGFEDWPLEPGSRDLVFAAQSFHWVDQEVGYRKAGQALRTGGTLALFWNRPGAASGPVHEALAALYEERAPGLGELTPEALAPVEDAIAGSIAATGLFEPPERRGFPWSQRLGTRHYVALLETYSAHATLPDLSLIHI